MSSPQNENKMGVMPVNKLLLSMSIPMMLSMLVQALYNVVDSVFVSRISEDALNAVSLAFPIQNLMIAVSVGTGVGINAQLSRYLGSKDQKHADATAVNGLFVSIISLLVFGLIAADVMQRQEEQGRAQISVRRNRALTREHLARLRKNGMRARLIRV